MYGEYTYLFCINLENIDQATVRVVLCKRFILLILRYRPLYVDSMQQEQEIEYSPRENGTKKIIKTK